MCVKHSECYNCINYPKNENDSFNYVSMTLFLARNENSSIQISVDKRDVQIQQIRICSDLLSIIQAYAFSCKLDMLT